MVDSISRGLPSAHWPAFFVHRLKHVGRTLYNAKVSHHVLTAVIRSFLLIARHFSRLSFALAAAFYRVAKYQLLLSVMNLSLPCNQWIHSFFRSPRRHDLILTSCYSTNNQMGEHTTRIINTWIRVFGWDVIISHMISFSWKAKWLAIFHSSRPKCTVEGFSFVLYM